MWTSFHPRRASNWSLTDENGNQIPDQQQQHHQQNYPQQYSRNASSISPRDNRFPINSNEDPISGPLLAAKASRGGGTSSFPTLWQLQIDDPHKNNASRIIDDESQHQNDQRRSSAASSSPSSSRHMTLNEIRSSGSPPSPFGLAQSDCSPPSTPPDTISTSGFGSTKRHWNMFTKSETMRKELDERNSNETPQVDIAIPDSTITLTKSSSRNDIFSASSPLMQPAPRLSLNDQETQTPTISPPQQSRRENVQKPKSSRQSGFFYGTSPIPSSSLPSPIEPFGQPFKPRSSSLLSVDDSDRPSYGRSNTEERERERERIRQTNMEIEFRLCPIKELMLGEGRHSNVYLGSYRVKGETQNQSSSFNQEEGEGEDQDDHEWTLCAMKRPHPDRQSQLLALEEAFALRRLGPHPNIVRLIKIRDEVQLNSRPNSPGRGNKSTSDLQSQNQNQNQQELLGLGLPSKLLTSSSSNRNRATSELISSETNTKLDPLRSQAHLSSNALQHRRNISQPDQSKKDQPSVRVVAPDEEVSKSPRIDDWDSDSNNNYSRHHEAPRLLMLLELLPFSLSSFSRRNPELVDLEQWKAWALELVRVVEWMHSKGCIHADLKPENVLLTSDLHVKLCDFNSALFPSSTMPLMDGMGLGTPAYGAPELSRNLNSSSKSYKGFSYPVDIWSLGAILYTLATGFEPFRRARSMIDMMYRKRIFFESEENDRVARMSVAEGSSTAGPASHYASMNTSGQASLPASRKSSIRSRRSEGTGAVSTPLRTQSNSMHKRAPSTESVSSITSSMVVSSTSGMRPSIQAIEMLLDGRTPTGLLMIPGSPQMALRNLNSVTYSSPGEKNVMKNGIPSFATINGHHRASSMGKARSQQYTYDNQSYAQQRWSTQPSHESGQKANERNGQLENSTGSPSSSSKIKNSTFLGVRPDILRRTTSYNGAEGNNSSEQQKQQEHSEAKERNSQDEISREGSKKIGENSQLRLAVAATFARSSNNNNNNNSTSTGANSHQKSYSNQDNEVGNMSGFSYDSRYSFSDQDERNNVSVGEFEDMRPYRDGTPALILPGGGRLPDEIRSLLEKMLQTDPDLRPTAKQVREKLESF